MRVFYSALLIVGLVAAGLLIGGWSDRDSLADVTVEAKKSSAPAHQAGSAGTSTATVYRASLTPISGSGVTGEAMVRVKGDRLLVSVNAKGLKPSVKHAQHIHANATCKDFGGIFVTLDNSLSNQPGNPDPSATGDSYPTATPGGTVNYRQTDTKSAVEEALGKALDLANRTVVVHQAGNPVGPPAACGELNPVGN